MPNIKRYNGSTNLKIGCWNVQGLYSRNVDKTRDANFLDELRGYDIIGLVETHTVEHTQLQVGDYYTCWFHRPQHVKATHGSGGVGVLLRNSIRPGIKIKPSPNRDYVWLELDKDFFHLKENLSVCVAYIPPPDSTYIKRLHEDILDKIESDVYNYKKQGDIILMGDLNARVACSPDYIDSDTDKHLPLDEDYMLDSPNRTRYSQDEVIDDRGKHLLEICVGAQIRILNGRKLGDSLGYFTSHQYNGSSVVDYAICSESIFDDITYFKVHSFKGTLSDHCMISFTFRACVPTAETATRRLYEIPQQYKWGPDSKLAFEAALTLTATNTRLSELRSLTETVVDDRTLNLAVNSLTTIYKTAAKISLKLKRHLGRWKKNAPPWSTCQLIHMKKNVDKKGREMCANPTGENRRRFFSALKFFRKARKYAKRHYINQQIENLSKLRNENPKKFWHALQILNNTKTDNPADKIEPGVWYDYLLKLNKSPPSHTSNSISDKIIELAKDKSFCELDFMVQEGEINEVIKGLKSNKAVGLDSVSNEMIKSSASQLTPYLQQIFNKVLSLGIYPEQWGQGIITNIHKKGSCLEPQNYRSITITSAIGKLFNAILNKRLETYLQKNHMISASQIGFEKGSSTTDHIFTLKTIIDKSTQHNNEKLYVCFVDFKQAFDSVWHTGLMYKLLKLGINNHFFRVIQNMYAKTVLCVKCNHKITDHFKSDIGIRQGDNLSPTLFKIYINDLEKYVAETRDTNPVKIGEKYINCLLYADDVVFVSKSKDGLQNCLNALKQFSEEWKLQINQQKTKVMIFNKRGKIFNEEFMYGDIPIMCTAAYTYLGLQLNLAGNFGDAITNICNKASKALYKLNHLLDNSYDIITIMHIFDHTIKPILLYGAEVWGISQSKETRTKSEFALEKALDINNKLSSLELKFYKRILGVRRNTSSLAVRGEIGRPPLLLEAIYRSIKHMLVIQNKGANKLVKQALKENIILVENGKKCWLKQVMGTLKDINMQHLANASIGIKEVKRTGKKIKTHLLSRYKTFWAYQLDQDTSPRNKNMGNKLRTYKLFKRQFSMEPYLYQIENIENRKALCQLRVSSHPLNIESLRGRVADPEQRICTLCNQGRVEDEFHFLMECHLYDTERTETFKRILKHCENFALLSLHDKFIWLLSNEDKQICKHLSRMTKILFDVRKRALARNAPT